MGKIIDCVTFYDNNYIFDFRYKVIEEFVDKFVICESLYDHKNNFKNKNFDLYKKYKNNPKVKKSRSLLPAKQYTKSICI